jgi:hypothetical protein
VSADAGFAGMMHEVRISLIVGKNAGRGNARRAPSLVAEIDSEGPTRQRKARRLSAHLQLP